MALTNLLEKIRHNRLEAFVAPIVEADEVYVWTVQNRIPYRMRVVRPRPGWWIMHPHSESAASIAERASLHTEIDFLAQLPMFRVIMLMGMSEHSALCIPYNASDAAQRGWPNCQPRLIHLPRFSYNPLDVVVARSLAGTLLYDEISTRTLAGWVSEQIRNTVFRNRLVPDNPLGTPEMRLGAEIVLARLKEAEREQEVKRVLEQKVTVEERLAWQLAFMGASLQGWVESPVGYAVTWEFEGHTYDMRIRKDLRVDSAGICLDGTDSDHNLSAIVAVMQEARRLRRPDLRE